MDVPPEFRRRGGKEIGTETTARRVRSRTTTLIRETRRSDRAVVVGVIGDGSGGRGRRAVFATVALPEGTTVERCPYIVRHREDEAHEEENDAEWSSSEEEEDALTCLRVVRNERGSATGSIVVLGYGSLYRHANETASGRGNVTYAFRKGRVVRESEADAADAQYVRIVTTRPVRRGEELVIDRGDPASWIASACGDS